MHSSFTPPQALGLFHEGPLLGLVAREEQHAHMVPFDQTTESGCNGRCKNSMGLAAMRGRAGAYRVRYG